MGMDEEELAQQRANAGDHAAQLLGIVDERFMELYTEAGDALAVLLAEMINRGLPINVCFGQLHTLVVDIELGAIAQAAREASGE